MYRATVKKIILSNTSSPSPTMVLFFPFFRLTSITIAFENNQSLKSIHFVAKQLINLITLLLELLLKTLRNNNPTTRTQFTYLNTENTEIKKVEVKNFKIINLQNITGKHNNKNSEQSNSGKEIKVLKSSSTLEFTICENLS